MDLDNNAIRRFDWVDYLIFVTILIISSLIGVYHAYKGSSGSTSQYLMGGKEMGILPIALSLAASTMSAIVMLGTPADIYFTGTMNCWTIVDFLLSAFIAGFIFLKIYHHLQVVSSYQYLELRFNYVVRRIATIMYIIKQLLYMAIVVYTPSLALRRVTGIDVYIAVTIMFLVCTFYTSIGGIKAVVWTDAVQVFLMYGSVIALLIKGVTDIGGWDVVWQRNLNTSRIEFFNIDPDPTTRHTIWSVVIGGFFYWTSFYATDQSIAQRFLAMPTLRQAQIAMGFNSLATAGIFSLCSLSGIVAAAKYFDCDPLTSKMIQKSDEIIPYFLMDTVGSWTGMPGLFVAGVFSGSLSSLSSGLNSVALVVLEDFIRPFFPSLKDAKATRITKGISIGFGCICFATVFLVSKVKAILDATVSFNGAVGGSLLGVFVLGVFVPSANWVGATVGMATSFTLMMWLGIASQMAKASGYIHNQMKPLSVENCPYYFNATSDLPSEDKPQGDFFFLLKISYLWYTLIGALITVIIGTLVSLLVKRDQTKQLANPRLFFHLFQNNKVRPAVDVLGIHNINK